MFRSDYRPLVFKLGLPAPVAHGNWQELAPYNRGEAEASSGRRAPTHAREPRHALPRPSAASTASRTRGLYRPITLNMVGLVLERMGRALEGDPARLIQSYLTTCLTKGDARDFAKPVLSRMITDAGTKEPGAEADLAASARLEPWQVKATLSDLAEQGLVRRLEGRGSIWEVSHDFLAPHLGQLIGRLKPTPLRRAGPFIAPVTLLGWIALAALALPYWMEREAEAVLLRDQVNLAQHDNGTRLLGFFGDDEKLRRLSPIIASLKGSKSLILAGDEVTNLEPLVGITGLTALRLFTPRVANVEPLKSLTSLTSLELSDSPIADVGPLQRLPSLLTLKLSGTRVAELEPLRGLTSLSDLDLSRTSVAQVEPLAGLTRLIRLDLSGTSIASVRPLESLTSLVVLKLSGTRVASLEPLKGLSSLGILDLSGTPVTSVEPLKGLTGLNELHLANTRVDTLQPLKVFLLSFMVSARNSSRR